MRRLIAFLVLTTLAAATTATAGALSKDQLSHRVNALCKTFNADSDAAANSSNGKRQAYRRIVRLQAKLNRTTKKITPPKHLAKPYAKFLHFGRLQLGFLKRARDHAEDEAYLKKLDREAKAATKGAKRVNRKLATPDC